MSNDKTNRAPTHELFTLKDNAKGKAFWTKIGAAWPHKDGKGFDLSLNAIPLDGRIVMREPKEETAET